jgi:hypothetical protein
MSVPTSLRNIPPRALQIAQHLCEQTGLSIADVLRQAIVSGLLVEATRIAPAEDGTLGGLEAAYLAKALRRHLSSAIDLLIEYDQHPYHMHQAHAEREVRERILEQPEKLIPQGTPEKVEIFEAAIGDDLDMLGLGISLSGTMKK